MERHLTIIQTVKIVSLSQYRYSDTSFNTNLNIEDKVWWQLCDLKPLHKVLFVCLVLFLSLCVKFLQQGVQVYLKHKEIQKFWVLHLHTVLPTQPSTNTVLTQEKKEPTDDTSIDVYSQQVNSTCFGQHYAHRQENRLYKTTCGVSLDVLAAVVWSWDMS